MMRAKLETTFCNGHIVRDKIMMYQQSFRQKHSMTTVINFFLRSLTVPNMMMYQQNFRRKHSVSLTLVNFFLAVIDSSKHESAKLPRKTFNVIDSNHFVIGH